MQQGCQGIVYTTCISCYITECELPLVGSTMQLWGYLFHICAKDEELSTVFTTLMGH